jgi:hypothetical protein
MKRCAMLFEQVARKWIPQDLALYPYNARFIDVTTATGLRECTSERHPFNRMQHRESNRKLARYVGDELNLVLGGEHGRWWGADIYNYWEGMQSGGFYSWPAGYVGEDIPKARADIGKDYLEWGLGEANRYPLWELVFHDCVVSTWYWGDSTGHLRQAAPELGYKQDAFNILYGTIPVYWVAQDYSYDWSKPETRARLLESYRNTCKLHEAIGFQEMVSHEFVTADRAVQHTTFGDGTRVWVNFGEAPWTLDLEGKAYTLPQYGFYAKGPQIEQYRAAIAGAPVATVIRRPDYLYAEGDIPGLLQAGQATGVTIRRDGPARLQVTGGGAQGIRLNWRALAPDAGEGPWWIVSTDSAGTPVAFSRQLAPAGDTLTLPESTTASVTLVGPAALANAAELVVSSPASAEPGRVRQGEVVTVRAQVRNLGGQAADGTTVALYLADLQPANQLQRQIFPVPAHGATEVEFAVPTALYDGPCRLLLRADDAGLLDETVTADNTATTAVQVTPDWSRWDCTRDLAVSAGGVDRYYPVVSAPFDLAAARAACGQASPGDPAAIRVYILDDAGAPARQCASQYLAAAVGGPRLVWELPGSYPAGATLRCRVYMDAAAAARHRQSATPQWHPETQTVTTSYYGVRFGDGYIRGVSIPALDLPVLTSLGVSSKDTGWVDEMGQVQSFQVLETGPLATQIRVTKQLNGGHSYDKLYTFYPAYFEVTTLSPERFGCPSRAYYAANCAYADDKGHQAQVDGLGDAEGISGQNQGPAWYATWGDTWSLSCIAVTPADNITYWDAGGKGGISLDTWRQDPATVAYCFSVDTRGGLDGPALAALEYRRLHEPLSVTD